jgi:hypothetical protein
VKDNSLRTHFQAFVEQGRTVSIPSIPTGMTIFIESIYASVYASAGHARKRKADKMKEANLARSNL